MMVSEAVDSLPKWIVGDTMQISIGDNIRRQRIQKGVTQEQLSEALGITAAAVSKWERNETFPDITLLCPLAYYFDVSLDELMGYNREKIEQEIEEIIKQCDQRPKGSEITKEFITGAYRKYPNDYRIMHRYMWVLGGDYADNDPVVLLKHKEEFFAICDKILEGCTNEKIRLDAWNMKAKVLHAEGRTEEALAIYQAKFADWYTTTEQKSEQLFAKDTPQYLHWVKRNMFELASFAVDKFTRSIYFDPKMPKTEAIQSIEANGDRLTELREQTDQAFFAIMEYTLFGRLQNDMYYRGGGTPEDLERIREKKLSARKALHKYAKADTVLAEAAERLSIFA
jgi:transcriptional regulator with XRE-family HTH domain